MCQLRLSSRSCSTGLLTGADLRGQLRGQALLVGLSLLLACLHGAQFLHAEHASADILRATLGMADAAGHCCQHRLDEPAEQVGPMQRQDVRQAKQAQALTCSAAASCWVSPAACC